MSCLTVSDQYEWSAHFQIASIKRIARYLRRSVFHQFDNCDIPTEKEPFIRPGEPNPCPVAGGETD